jgi:hypothetical protein
VYLDSISRRVCTSAPGFVSPFEEDVIVTTVSATSSRLRSALAAATCLVALVLAGCESNNALTNVPGPETNLAAAKPLQPAPPPASRVAVVPVIGAPDPVGRQLVADFTSAIGSQRAVVVPAGDRADYTVRGYIVAAKDKANTKVSYIWDITDPTGKRLNRITGEEVVTGQAPKDPWAAVTPPITQAVAQKSAASFSQWLQTATLTSGPGPVAGQQPPVGVGGTSPVATASTPPGTATAMPAPANTGRPPLQNASVSAVGTSAIVPPVTGAPGDGAVSLTRALQSELTKSGVSLANAASTSTYRVEGVVQVGQPDGGKQSVQIDWNVRDPQGKRLGTVTQKNEIPEGSLDGQWGRVADAAAAAAAQGIVKLLPQSR